MSSEIVVPAPTGGNPAEEEFLTRFERENVPSEYKEHYLAKECDRRWEEGDDFEALQSQPVLYQPPTEAPPPGSGSRAAKR